MATKFIVFALLLITCCSASPLRAATGSSLIVLPILVQELEEPLDEIADEPIVYALNGNSEVAESADRISRSSFDVAKRSADETGNAEDDDDDDLETAAGTNVLRPLFVYRQQVAYRQRARDAIRRGRRI